MPKFETRENTLIWRRFRATYSRAEQQQWVSQECLKVPLTAKWGDSPTVLSACDMRSNDLKKQISLKWKCYYGNTNKHDMGENPEQ